MNDNDTPTKSALTERQIKLQQAEHRQRIVSRYVYGCMLFLIVVFLEYFTGDPLGILGVFGIEGVSYQKTGAYVDCTQRENRNHSYCKLKGADEAASKTWKNMKHSKKGSQFTLHGK
ncbi:hypothetical protein OAO01_05405 [Oligoflexia bacterium]|nr:hypothetical protein [Oligoflexia bacterium]